MANASGGGNAYVPASGGVAAGVVAKNLIFDSQIVSDVFPTAVRLLAWAHAKGIINLLAITSSINDASISPNPGPQVLSQILATAGVTGVVLSSGPTTTNVTGTESENLTTFLSQAFVPARRLQTIAGLSTSVPVLRSVLASATTPVDILTAGPYNNLYDLLNSAPDSISALTGAQLVAQKVGTLYSMGGQYPLSTAPVGAEFNFGNVAGFTTTLWPITNTILTTWPTPIVFIGFEMGPYGSMGAYWALTPTDPLGYYYANWVNSTTGRMGWNEIAALIALQGPAFAGFTSVFGTNSINTSTGFNTFAAGGGNHSYVVPLVSQRALQQKVDSICAPGVTQPTAFTQVAEVIQTTPATASQVDGSNLILWYFASDLGLTNGASVTSWPDRCGRSNLVQATVALQPTYNTAKNAKVGVNFSGAQALVTDVALGLPHEISVYAYLCFDTITASFALAMAHGASSGSTNIRNFDMQRGRTGDPSGCCRCDSVIQGQFITPLSAGASANTWVVFAFVRGGSTVTAYLNGTAGSPLTITVPSVFDALYKAVSNYIVGLLTVGGQYIDGGPTVQNGLIGGIREIRIYNNAHSAATVAAVSTAMTT